ncbi:MAG TPA: LacI family transcriptional regulator [Rhodospirillales bacterium]|nr:LacI family transcriptional regulator [Rhodospirillales bacterium]
MARINLKELSRRLGLSMTTVSRALNGYPDVSPSTRERVVSMARELGYAPNAAARRLTSGRSETIGFVPQNIAAYYGNPYFADLLAGIGETLHAANFDLVLACVPEGEAPLDVCRRLVEGRRVDGLILDRTFTEDPRIDYLAARGFPFATLGRDRQAARHAFLDIDGERALEMATRRLLALGHREIAFIAADPRFNFVRERLAGYRRALADAGIPRRRSLVRHDGFGEEAGARAARALMRLCPRPTAILCIEDLTAIGAMRALRELGLRPGREVSVIGYNDIPLARIAEPPLTTIRMPIREAGRRLAAMVLALLEGAAPADLQEIWEPELVPRESDGPPPSPARGLTAASVNGPSAPPRRGPRRPP